MQIRPAYVLGGYFRSVGSYPLSLSSVRGAKLGNNKIVVAGGYTGSAPVNNVFIYDPLTQVFTSVAVLSANKTYHSAFSLDDGGVAFTGGNTDVINYVATTDYFDYKTNTVTSAGQLTTGRSSAIASGVSDGRGYVALGTGVSGNLTSAERFSFKHKTFSALTSWPGQLVNSYAAETADGNLYVRGLSTNHYEYNPVNDSVSTSVLSTTTRSYHASLSLIDGTVFNVCGRDSGAALSSTEVYYPRLKVIKTGVPFSSAIRDICGVSSPSGNLLVGGTDGTSGFSYAFEYEELSFDSFQPEFAIMGGAGAAGAAISSCEKFNSAVNVFKTIASLATANKKGAGSYYVNGSYNRALIAGGTDNTNGYNTSQKLDPLTETFSAISGSLQTQRVHAFGLTVSDPTGTSKRAMLVGGRISTSGSVHSTTEWFNPLSEVWSTLASALPFQRYSLAGGEVASSSGALTQDGIVTGGYDNSDTIRKELYRYSFSGLGVWAAVTSGDLPTPTALQAGCRAFDNLVIFAGGKQLLAASTGVIYRFDNSTGITSTLGATISSRFGASAAPATDGNVIVFGGTTNDSTPVSTVEYIDVVNGTVRVLGSMNTARFYAAATPAMNPMSLEVHRVPDFYFDADRNETEFQSGEASVQIATDHTQKYELFVNEGDVVTISAWLKKNAAYTDSGVTATCTQLQLVGCGINEKVNMTGITSTGWTQSTALTGTALCKGVVKLQITNQSNQPLSMVYVDNIVLQ